ncbi:protein kinase [Streptomyces sp. NPDC021020]|uniref:protein kinase domain-containing protein n=1 Tax=Streptomyces sp. NPDC021020 TaxID=3365109 RepID=UPI00379B0DAE
MVRARLHAEFRYIHEPLPAGDTAIPTLGHESLVTTLQERLTYSHGGAFLVTGFRGVGKSTLVLRALAQTARSWGRGDHLLLVHLNVARAMTADQLLFAIVRRVFEALDDGGLLARLPPDVLDSLVMAYTRTSLSFKQTQSESSERGSSVGLAPSGGGLASLNLTGRRTRAQALETSFLAYSETDVEHDLVRIVRLLGGDEGGPRPVRRGRWRRRGRDEPRLRVHPVIVLDEVDKLTDNREEALADFEQLLGRLKNVLTVRGAHFLVVAGPDLHDRALSEGDHGNGVYESVFSWRAYVPCLWQAPRRLVGGLVAGTPLETAEGEPEPGPELLDDLARYLAFKARGVPRRLLHEFNALVAWEDGAPYMTVGAGDRERVRFYRELEEILAGVGEGRPPGIASLPIDEDRRRLGDYAVADWALRSQGRPFTSADVMSTAGDQRLDPLLRVAPNRTEQVLRHLARAGVLTRVHEHTVVTRFGESRDGAQLPSYRLSDGYRRALAGFARGNERERADQGVVWASAVSEVSRAELVGARPAGGTGEDDGTNSRSMPLVGVLADGRYEIRELIGHGGMGSVYLGRDRLTGEDVAIKLMHHRLTGEDDMVQRFRREASAGQLLHHPNIVRIRGLEMSDGGEPALVMEFLEGISLAAYTGLHGPLSPAAAVTVGRRIGSALGAVERARLARIDLKPTNIILHPVRGPVVIDLGLARLVAGEDSITRTGVLVGTVGYMTPEHLTGGPYDIRTDLYTLGLVMIYCLTGESVWRSAGSDVVTTLHRIATEDVPVDGLPVSEQLRALLGRTTARSPGDRPSVEGFLDALRDTPEGEVTDFLFR